MDRQILQEREVRYRWRIFVEVSLIEKERALIHGINHITAGCFISSLLIEIFSFIPVRQQWEFLDIFNMGKFFALI
jgi:hypothetical protein